MSAARSSRARFTREPDPDRAAIRQTDATITTLRLGAAGEQDMNNPKWVKFLIFGNDGFSVDAANKLVSPPDSALVVRKPLLTFIPDSRHAILAAVLIGNAPLDTLAQGSAAVQDVMHGRTFDNATVTVTGTPTFLTDINNYLQGGMLVLGGIAVLVMMVILLVAFRVRWRLLPLVGMAVGIAWGFGAFGFTGTKLSLVTIAGLPILIGLGIEFAIQIQNRIEEERGSRTIRGTPFEATLQHMGPPLVAATIAAVIAFLTVKISKVPMVQDFGVLLSIGIVALLIAGIVVPTTLIGARERRSPTTKEPKESWVEAHRRPARQSAACRCDTARDRRHLHARSSGWCWRSGSKIESDPINWADQSSTSIKNARHAEEGDRLRHDARRLHRDRAARRPTVSSPIRWVRSSSISSPTRLRESGAGRCLEPGDHGRLARRGARHDVAASDSASTCCRPTTSPRSHCRSCSSPTAATPHRCCTRSAHPRCEQRSVVLDNVNPSIADPG